MKTTKAKYGDRWDLLAYDLFGDASLAPELISANSHLSDVNSPQLNEGTEIIIPDITQPSNNITSVKAPWKH